MSRRIVVAALAGVLMTLAWPLSASASKPPYACPPSFEQGALPLDAATELPKHQDAVAAGVFESQAALQDFLADFYATTDHNGDGLICWKTVPPSGGNPSFWAYFYNGVDNNASVPSG